MSHLQSTQISSRYSNASMPQVSQRGQGMTEYIIIVALISVAAIAAYQYFGQVIRAQTAAMAKELAGDDGTAQNRSAKAAADGAAKQSGKKTLNTFTGNGSASAR